jgi:hypothetical protein
LGALVDLFAIFGRKAVSLHPNYVY